ncbi:MAG: FKBP-type peptidylprolyl isomerase [Verrucomicrobiales bacterium VVV1]|nr:MAG: FKBP-type peptidylprolyl isomerase [Verrucomicrobiales bacterium VVV1]
MKFPQFLYLSALALVLATAPVVFSQTDMPETPSDVKAAPADAAKTATGLASKVLTKGTGSVHPSAADTVTVHYSGWTTDGKLFDSSVKRGEPTSFPLNGVIKGWTEGVQLMVEGEKRRFWIPADLAYGENPGGGRPGGLLVFDIELISIKHAPKPPADLASAPADAVKSESGLVSKVTAKGTGTDHPKDGDTAKLNLSLWSSDGQLLQSTAQQGAPADIPLEQLRIGGLAEGIKLMVAGEKRQLWISSKLAFGDTPPPGAPAGGLVVEAELISIKAGLPAPETPSDVAAAPADAEKTSSGLASKVLAKGTGTTHPKASDTVTVHYSGWTTDGKLFDSSVKRGEPTSFPLTGVIAGWTEGVQLMVVGEKRRFWIPGNLAYGEKSEGGRPGGLLVFDVELIKIGE